MRDEQKFDEWLVLERGETGWLDELPNCPKCLLLSGSERAINPDSSVWENPSKIFPGHPGATWCMRSIDFSGSGQHCCYDSDAMLLTREDGEAAGTPDRRHYSYVWPLFISSGDTHWAHDVDTHNLASRLGRESDYLDVRPPNEGGGN